MHIGVLTERKQDETRVAICPTEAQRLTAKGHVVYIERGAGARAGYADSEYEGCRICERETVYDECRLLVKVKCPEPDEVRFLGPRHTLFTFLHFDENISPSRMSEIVHTGVTGIAFEWVCEDAAFPILQPMSELTGGLFAMKAMTLLLDSAGLVGRIYGPRLPLQRAVVVGMGHIGTNAVNVLARNGFSVTVVDKHIGTVDARLRKVSEGNEWGSIRNAVHPVAFDEDKVEASISRLREAVAGSAIVINAAVRRPTLPKTKCEFLIPRSALSEMAKGGVLCDATACDADLVETAYSSSSLTATYVADGIVHYNCDHIPALAPRSASRLLSHAIYPYVNQLAEDVDGTINADLALSRAVMCYNGMVTHEFSAKKKGLPFADLRTAMELR